MALVSAAIATVISVTGVQLLVHAPLLVLVLLPFAAILLSPLERRRVTLVGMPAIPAAHVPIPRSKWLSWFKIRATEPATWRDSAHLVITVITSMAYAAIFAADAIVGSLILAFIIVPESMPVRSEILAQLPFLDDRTNPLVITLAVAALTILLAITMYLVTLIAIGQAAIARILISPRQEELEEQVLRLRASRVALLASFHDEQRALERVIHDHAQQRLVSLSVSLGLARVELSHDPLGTDHVAASVRLITAAQSHAESALSEIRDALRGSHNPILDDLGLHAAVQDLASRSALPVSVHGHPTERLSEQAKLLAYSFVNETLTNVMKHSGSTSASVTFENTEGQSTITVIDNGKGGANFDKGSGLRGLRERAEAVNGSMTVSSPQNGPTTIVLALSV